MNKKTVKDIDLKGKRVFMRVDFNVPMADGKVTDDKRIKAALPTIQICFGTGCIVLLMSHLGRPKGGPDPEFSLRAASEVLVCASWEFLSRWRPIASARKWKRWRRNSSLAKCSCSRTPASTPAKRRTISSLRNKWLRSADVYVNDAFGSAHRAHSSTEGIARFLPAVSGFLMEQELEYLGRAVANPEHPYIAILGGAKISDKILVVETLLSKCDKLIIGGGMANTFLAAQGTQHAGQSRGSSFH